MELLPAHMRVTTLHNSRVDHARFSLPQRRRLPPREIHQTHFIVSSPGVLPRPDACRREPVLLVPENPLRAASAVNMAADGEPRPHPPERSSESLTPRRLHAVRFIAASLRRGVRDHNVSTRRYVIPQTRRGQVFAGGGGDVVGKRPEAVSGRVWRPKDCESSAWSLGGA